MRMEGIRRILCATERGHEASEAVAQAEAIARTHDARAEFLALAPGDPVSRVLRKAQAFEADLLVVDASSPGGPGENLVESVIRHAPCAVLAARPSPRDRERPRRVGPPRPRAARRGDRRGRGAPPARAASCSSTTSTRGSRASGGECLTTLIGIVSDPLLAEVEGAARHRTKEALARFGAGGESILAHGAPAASVLRLAGTLPAELVVIGSPGETSLKSLLFGSVVETIVHWAPCSVLVVPVFVVAARAAELI